MRDRIVLHAVPHTHWDREWYEPFEGYRFRLVKTCDRLLEVLDADKDFRHFNFDGQTAAIEDYLEVRPELTPIVSRFVKDGRIAIGPWRILMDEFLCSPETIVRNIRQGTASATRLGRSMRVGYIPDSFGHISQMPQILRLAGLKDACVWRGVPGAVDRTAFWWAAPDGSEVRTAYLATSYSNAATMPDSAEALIERARRIVADLEPFRPGSVVLAMNGTDHRGPEEHLPEVFAKANAMQDEIEFRIGSVEEYLARAPSDELPLWEGEMRSSARANLLMGVVSARMPLKQAEFAASTALERYAEPLSAIAGTEPGTLLEHAWRGMVENSAHDSICGCGIDAVAAAVAVRYDHAERVAGLVADDALDDLASRVDTRAIAGGTEGLVVWNPSPRARGGVVEAALTVSVDPPEALVFRTPGGLTCPAQVIVAERERVVDMDVDAGQLARIVPTIHSRMIGRLHINDVTIEEGRTTTIRLRLGAVPEGVIDVEARKREVESLIARKRGRRFRVVGDGPPTCRVLVQVPDVPALGWTALVQAGGEAGGGARAAERGIENELLRAEVEPAGTVALTDLTTGARFAGLFALEDGGDAGDEYNYSPPDRDTVVTTPSAEPHVAVVSSGPIEARVRVTARYRIPEGLSADERARARRTVVLPVQLEYALRAGEPFLRATIEVRNEARDHRLRALFPLPFAALVSHADSAFHVVERGLEAEGGPNEHGLATYPCRRWVDASDGEHGLAVLHQGTPEYELVGGTTLALTLLRCVGWLSRSSMRYRGGPAGPRLPAPLAQLPGTHRFEVAVYPHAGDWRAARAHDVAERFAYPLKAAVARAHAGSLPPEGATLTIEPDTVQLSALHRDHGTVVCRVYNASADACQATLRFGAPLRVAHAARITLHGEEIKRVRVRKGAIALQMRPWEIVTLRLAP